MNAFRRALLESPETPAALQPEAMSFMALQAAASVVFVDHAELYRRLLAAARAGGLDDERRAAALEGAGDLGTVMQALRSREELLQAVAERSELATVPTLIIDQLFYSLVLLADAAPGTAADLDGCLTEEQLDELLHADQVTRWMEKLKAGDVDTQRLFGRWGLGAGGDLE